MDDKKGFVFYRSWWIAIVNLPRDVRGDVLTAIVEYGLNGATTGQLKPIAKAILEMAKPQIDINNSRYLNGKKGGCPQGVSNNPNGRKNKSITNQEQTKNLPSSNQKQTKNKAKEKDKYKEKDNITSSLHSEVGMSDCESDAKQHLINEKKFCEYFNAELDKHKSIIPKIRTIGGTRLTHLEARSREHGKEALALMVQKAVTSDFLNGRNKHGWKATFDWLILPNNFIKVIEGVYDNDTTHQNNETQQRDKYKDRRGADSAARSAEDYTDTI